MTESIMYDVIIVGGGPGGLSAAIYTQRAALKTILIEKGVVGGQVAMTETVENYPGFEQIIGFELSQRFLKHAQSYGLELIQEAVATVEPRLNGYSVWLADGRVLSTYTVILATGGAPRKLGCLGEDEFYGKGVSYCGVCDGFFFRDKTVVVIGGGDTAAEEALYLAKIAKQVYLVHRRDQLRASMILQQRVKSERKIKIFWDTLVTEIVAGEGGVNGVLLRNVQTGRKRRLATDGVFIFIGFEPNNRLVPEGIKMNADGYVITNDRCETNMDGLYVIGDLREKYARQIVVAAGDGCTAALAASHFVETKKLCEFFRQPIKKTAPK